MGARVLSASGIEFEAELSFGALHQVLHPLSREFGRLLPVQRRALDAALGYGDGSIPDRLVLANAVLEVLSRVAAARPLVLIVDDLPWVDRASASVFSFVARRLAGTQIGFLGATRTGEESYFDRVGLAELELGPLGPEEARALMNRHFPSLTDQARERLLEESRGNPLAVLELPAALMDSEYVPVQGLPAVLPLNRRLERLFASRVNGLGGRARQLLLLAALDGTSDIRLLGQALDGELFEGLGHAEQARLINIDHASQKLSFHHPLIRSAVVTLATPEERRRAHATLAAIRSEDPERHAWHLAAAAVEPDESVASALDQAAQSSLQRGDAARAVAALTRAAELTPSPDAKAHRLAEAAYVGVEAAGRTEDASALLADAIRVDPNTDSLPAASAAAWLLLNGEGDVVIAHRLLLGAIETASADQHAPLDRALVEATYNLMMISWYAGREDLWKAWEQALNRLGLAEDHPVAIAGRTFPDPVHTAAAALPALDRAAAGFARDHNPAAILPLGTSGIWVDRVSSVRAEASRLIAQGRENGLARRHLGMMMHLCTDNFVTGRWDEGVALASEGLVVSERDGYQFFAWYFRYYRSVFAAVRGDHELSRRFADEVTAWAVPRGVRTAAQVTHHPRALSAIGRGDFETAYHEMTQLSPAGTLPAYVPMASWVAFDLVEASMRLGRASDAAAHVKAMTDARIELLSGRQSLLLAGAIAVCSTDDTEALAAFSNAVALPDADRWPFDLARVRLAYGERLRRSRKNVDARGQLRLALEVLERLDAEPWITRATGELRAAGGDSHPTVRDGTNLLTAQEHEIAQLAASGLTNKEIGERLFLSHRTVGFHLGRVFPKLGVRSRAALRDALSGIENGN
jgi:DNA-binding CsgD family transcriptional regulator